MASDYKSGRSCSVSQILIDINNPRCAGIAA